MYEDICYNTNDIKEVVCRLDFAMPTALFNARMPRDIFKIVRKYYPISEPQEVVGTELQINPMSGASVNKVISKRWVFWSRNKKSSCCIQAEAVIFTVTEYTRFEEIRSSILDVLQAVMEYDESLQGKRFGLRYINVIDILGHDDWIDEKSYDALLSHRNNFTTRLETTYEYAVPNKDLNVRLVYGYANPDYPAIMKRELFTVDIDAYVQSIIYKEDVKQMVDDAHYEVQQRFEGMITDAYRKKLDSYE